ncbi:MAG TPA: response regulator [Vicinamibacteria bacterium]|nr:response regulator [Vicinamibacteria bacterium]
MARKELGEILREADLVTDAQLSEALALQRTFGERLASVLVRQRILTEKFAVTYLGRQLGVPPIDLSKTDIDLSVLEIVPLELCERHLVFPVRVEGTRLQVAMSDPTDHVLVSEIEFKTGVRLAPMIALESSIKNAIIEARRALKSGANRITPNVQRHRDGEKTKATTTATPPVAPSPATVPVEHSTPVPLSRLEEKERAIFETLAGAPITASAPPPVEPQRIPAVEETQTILAVDDDEGILRLTEQLLQSRRYRVLTAKTGREALAKVRETMPDVVVLDGMLPEVHGFEICRQLKTSERFRHIPVLMMSAVHTGWRFAADVKEKYGADDYLEKPFEPAEFLRRVEVMLNKAPSVAPDSEAAARQHLKQGVIALKQDQLDDAVAAFHKGLGIDQFNDMLHYYLAMAYEKKDMVFNAIDHYEKAIQINPDFYDAITALANLYQRQEFWRKAVEMWELALAATQDETVRKRIKDHLLSLL